MEINQGLGENEGGVTGISATGQPVLTGDVTLSAGSNITLTQLGNDISIASAASSGLTIGSTTITSGTNTRILYDNSGVLGEYTTTGSGTVVAMQTSPTFITPVIGVATGTRLGLGQAADATASLALTQSGLGTTSTDGIILQNTTASANQISPRIRFSGREGGNSVQDWIMEAFPGASGQDLLRISAQHAGGGYVPVVSFLYNGGINQNTGIAFNAPLGKNGNLIYQVNGVNKWYVQNNGVSGNDEFGLVNSDANSNSFRLQLTQAGVLTLSGYGAGIATFDSSGNVSSGAVSVANGGTGQTSYTNGQLLIGNTTGNTLTKATLTGTSNQVVVTNGGGSITLSLPQDIATSSTPQFARLGLGGAADATYPLSVVGSGKFIANDANFVQVSIQDTHANGEGSFAVRNDNYYAALEVFGSNFNVSGLRNNALFTAQSGIVSLGFATLGSAPITFLTNSSGTSNERMRITEVGNIKIAGTATRGTTEGTNHLDIFNGTAPVGTLANGASLYSESGEMKVMDSAGNATQISPHDNEGNWIYNSKNTVTGKVLKIDMEKMMKFLNSHFGTDFIKEYIE